MFKGLKIGQVKKVASVSRKLSLNKSSLQALIAAQKEGADSEEVLSRMLNVPEGVAVKDYLQERVTPDEYEALNQLISLYTNGAGTNPLE